MAASDYSAWLQGLRVVVIGSDEHGRFALWSAQAGATVSALDSTACSTSALDDDLDVAVIDAGIEQVKELVDSLPAACGIVLVGDVCSKDLLSLAERCAATAVLADVPRDDFLFEVQRAATLQVPDIPYLVGRAKQLWKLPPRQADVLFYNLWSHSDQEIADAIGISVHTVQEHQNGLRRRTGVKTKYGYLRRLAESAGMRAPLADD